MLGHKAILKNDDQWSVVWTGLTEIRAKVGRAIESLGGMAGEW